jgi:hypothetical protein
MYAILFFNHHEGSRVVFSRLSIRGTRPSANEPSTIAEPSTFNSGELLGSTNRTAFSFQIIITAAIVFAAPFTLFYRLILFHFYVRGSFLLDTGLLASLMYHNTAALTLPPSLGGESFFAFHVAPILLLVSTVSYALPFSMAQLFAGFVGLCHGLLALSVFWLLVSGYGMQRGWALALAALTAGLFAFNGLAIAIARYPHFETLAAASLLLFFAALLLERRTIAIVCSWLPLPPERMSACMLLVS